MVLEEILHAFSVADKSGTAYSISEQMRRELAKTVPEIDCWSVWGSEAYELTRLMGQNAKWKLQYNSLLTYDLLLNASILRNNKYETSK